MTAPTSFHSLQYGAVNLWVKLELLAGIALRNRKEKEDMRCKIVSDWVLEFDPARMPIGKRTCTHFGENLSQPPWFGLLGCCCCLFGLLQFIKNGRQAGMKLDKAGPQHRIFIPATASINVATRRKEEA